MPRLSAGWLILWLAVLCAGCVATATPAPPTAGLITATAPASATLAPATAIAIVTNTPFAPPTQAPSAAVTSLPASATPSIPTATSAVSPGPQLPSSTPFVTTIPTVAAPPSSTPIPATVAPPTVPPATVPPEATAVPVGIQSFTISPQTINPGDSVTLAWQATGTQATIYWVEPQGPLSDMHQVPLSGTLTLPVAANLRGQVMYVLYVAAGTSLASATVTATIRCPDTWFFANPPNICPQGPGTLQPMVAERFEHGLMLWLSQPDMIYILYGDGGSPAWSSQANQWFQGQPESDPSLTPPAGLYQPVRGFGLAWRTANSVGQAPRDRLGWATEPEGALTGALQCDSAPKYTNCYLSGPGGVVYHLKPEFSGWEIWQGP